MEHFQNDDLEYVVDDYYYDMADFDDDDLLPDNEPQRNNDDSPDSDFEDDFETVIFILFRVEDFLVAIYASSSLLKSRNDDNGGYV